MVSSGPDFWLKSQRVSKVRKFANSPFIYKYVCPFDISVDYIIDVKVLKTL